MCNFRLLTKVSLNFSKNSEFTYCSWTQREQGFDKIQCRRAASAKKLEASLAEAAEEAAESQMEDDSAEEAADSEPEEEAAGEAGVSDKEANKENEQAASRRPGRKRGRQRHETAKDQPHKKKRPAQKRPFDGIGSCENSSQMVRPKVIAEDLRKTDVASCRCLENLLVKASKLEICLCYLQEIWHHNLQRPLSDSLLC